MYEERYSTDMDFIREKFQLNNADSVACHVANIVDFAVAVEAQLESKLKEQSQLKENPECQKPKLKRKYKKKKKS